MGVLPSTVTVYGVETGTTEAGQTLSPMVAKALDQVVERIVEEFETRHA
jgi:Ni,Fe-hydrogenase maturation factor